MTEQRLKELQTIAYDPDLTKGGAEIMECVDEIERLNKVIAEMVGTAKAIIPRSHLIPAPQITKHETIHIKLPPIG